MKQPLKFAFCAFALWASLSITLISREEAAKPIGAMFCTAWIVYLARFASEK